LRYLVPAAFEEPAGDTLGVPAFRPLSFLSALADRVMPDLEPVEAPLNGPPPPSGPSQNGPQPGATPAASTPLSSAAGSAATPISASSPSGAGNGPARRPAEPQAPAEDATAVEARLAVATARDEERGDG